MKRAALVLAAALLAAPLAAQAPNPPPGAAGWPSAAELAGSDPRVVLGAPAGPQLAGAALEANTHDVASLLRCPVCQGLSVADSPSSTAQNMRRQVRELLARGYDKQQVLVYFEHSYGEFVRLQPPLRGVNWLLWLAPAAVLLGGAVFVLRRGRAAGGPAAPPDPALDAYRARARALAFGDDPAREERR